MLAITSRTGGWRGLCWGPGLSGGGHPSGDTPIHRPGALPVPANTHQLGAGRGTWRLEKAQRPDPGCGTRRWPCREQLGSARGIPALNHTQGRGPHRTGVRAQHHIQNGHPHHNQGPRCSQGQGTASQPRRGSPWQPGSPSQLGFGVPVTPAVPTRQQPAGFTPASSCRVTTAHLPPAEVMPTPGGVSPGQPAPPCPCQGHPKLNPPHSQAVKEGAKLLVGVLGESPQTPQSCPHLPPAITPVGPC